MSANPPANPPAGPPASLARRLGTGDAVAIGLGSMLGAGVFAAFAPAAAAAGAGLLAGLAVAAVVAWCNATSSAQLAVQHPAAGGTYVYGREQLGEWWGFLAGWGFVVGKTASCAAMALVVAAYAAPPGWERPVAVAAVTALAAVNYRGITRTARLTKVLLVVVLLALAVVVAAGLGGTGERAGTAGWDPGAGGWYGTLQAAGLLFFAFAGYARIATLAEEVRDPSRTLPRAVLGALAGAAVVYAAVGTTALLVLGPDRLAASSAPLVDVVAAAGWGWAEVLVRVGATAGALGALLALVAGVGRTTMAMARGGDLPGALAAVHPRYRVPHRAEVAVAVVVVVVVLSVDVRGAIGFSSFGVLLYYLVANLAAWTQTGQHRRWPRPVQALGAAGCVVLVVTLPPASVLAGVAVFAVGVAYRLVLVRRRRASTSGSASAASSHTQASQGPTSRR
ncbi:APC family permease [Kineococcus terrestris]|uniref:APC family permease n=1 Tax=Kineococcus terrestris TaxID=2044856 RepID=UPI0034DB31C9